MTSLYIDIFVILLLLVTISYCWRLNNKILELKHSRKDLTDLVKTFDTAIIKTHKNISELKNMSASSTVELHSYVTKASELIGDLSFMTETASKLADRLEKNIVDIRPNNCDSFSKMRNEQLEKLISNLGNANNFLAAKSTSRVSKTKDEFLDAIKSVKTVSHGS